MDRSSPDPDPALAVGDDLKSAADHPIDPTPRADPPGGHPPNPADGSYTAHNTVGAFTEKSEITVNHKTSDDLRKAIQDKVERLLDMEVVDVEVKTLEEELGIDEPPATTGSAEETT
jgi:hypothetical protein